MKNSYNNKKQFNEANSGINQIQIKNRQNIRRIAKNKKYWVHFRNKKYINKKCKYTKTQKILCNAKNKKFLSAFQEPNIPKEKEKRKKIPRNYLISRISVASAFEFLCCNSNKFNHRWLHKYKQKNKNRKGKNCNSAETQDLLCHGTLLPIHSLPSA